MQLVKTAEGRTMVKMSRSEWEAMGREQGWDKVPERASVMTPMALEAKVSDLADALDSMPSMSTQIPDVLREQLEQLKGLLGAVRKGLGETPAEF